MKKIILAALTLTLVSFSGFADSSITLESITKPKAHWGAWGGVCRNGMWWCSLWQPAPVGANCYCNIPGYGSFWGWVSQY